MNKFFSIQVLIGSGKLSPRKARSNKNNCLNFETMFEKSKLIELLRGFVNIWNILRSILILICFYMFCDNAIKILKNYLQFNTIVMVEYTQPNETDLPGFTICGYSIVYDEELQQEYWQDYSSSVNLSREEKFAQRQKLREKAFQLQTAHHIFNKTGITFDSLVKECTFFPNSKYKENNGIPCTQITDIVESINQGKKCFTIFSQLNITRSRKQIKLEYEMNPFIQLLLANYTEATKDHFPNETSVFTLHSPNIIP